MNQTEKALDAVEKWRPSSKTQGVYSPAPSRDWWEAWEAAPPKPTTVGESATTHHPGGIMKTVYRFLKRYSFAVFVGAWLNELGYGLETWQGWVGIIGMTSLVAWREWGESK